MIPDATPLSKESFARRCDVSCEFRARACMPTYVEMVLIGCNRAMPHFVRRGLQCNVRWPCKGYDADFLTSACPLMWTLSGNELKLSCSSVHEKLTCTGIAVDGKACEAPPTYSGPCDAILRIGEASNAEKARLAAACELEWPVNFVSHYAFNEPCPLGWTLVTSPNQNVECHAPDEYFGHCSKVHNFSMFTNEEKYEFMMKCSATWPMKDITERNYEAACPSLWHLESQETGICTAPSTYTGPCQTRVDFRSFDADIKRAFEGRCRAFFPISAFATLPKLQPVLKALNPDAQGPIGPAETKYHGQVVDANGTVYLQSKGSTTSNAGAPQAPPKTPDLTASRAAATASHINKLRALKEAATDQHLQSIIMVRLFSEINRTAPINLGVGHYSRSVSPWRLDRTLAPVEKAGRLQDEASVHGVAKRRKTSKTQTSKTAAADTGVL
ncbi:uncharacterized protein LOC113147068 [Cyclospora cayetanensis]|uniref:Uncharacterized protein LOC113147068 n=1 Tax=Cyclospora cayetanensis TaxID=88456 RepID=A0A6P6RW15_9EIME|nr:uncharacterized protein LOC113147068 [Cyclospora cayetanensis]